MKEALTYEELQAELEKQRQINIRLSKTVLELTQKYRQMEQIALDLLQNMAENL